MEKITEVDGVIHVVALSQADYVRALGMQRDPIKRVQMKMLAHGAMYSSNRNLKVLLPPRLIPDKFRPLDKH